MVKIDNITLRHLKTASNDLMLTDTGTEPTTSKEKTQRHCDYCKKKMKSWLLYAYTRTVVCKPGGMFRQIKTTNYACDKKQCREKGEASICPSTSIEVAT